MNNIVFTELLGRTLTIALHGEMHKAIKSITYDEYLKEVDDPEAVELLKKVMEQYRADLMEANNAIKDDFIKRLQIVTQKVIEKLNND